MFVWVGFYLLIDLFWDCKFVWFGMFTIGFTLWFTWLVVAVYVLLFGWLFALLDVWLVTDCVRVDWFWVIVIVVLCGCVVGFEVCFVVYSSAYRFLWLRLCLLFGLMCLFRFKVMVCASDVVVVVIDYCCYWCWLW